MAISSKIIFKVDGVQIPTPSDFTLEYNPITESERLENGDMAITGIAGKYKGVLSYNFITESDLEIILGKTWDEFIASKNITHEFTFPTPKGEKTIKTYFSPFSIKMTPTSLKMGGYEGLQISFIEL